MVVSIGQYGTASLFDNRVINGRGKHDFGCRTGFTASTASGWYGKFRNGCRFAFKAYRYRVIVILRHLTAEKRTSIYLVQFSRHCGILNGISGIEVQGFVHFGNIHIDSHVPGFIRGLFLTVESYLLDRTCAPVLFPRSGREETIDTCSGKAVISPFPCTDLESDNHSQFRLVCDVSPGKSRHSRFLGVVAAAQRLLNGNIIEARTAARTSSKVFPLGSVVELRSRIARELLASPALCREENEHDPVLLCLRDVGCYNSVSRCRDVRILGSGVQHTVHVHYRTPQLASDIFEVAEGGVYLSGCFVSRPCCRFCYSCLVCSKGSRCIGTGRSLDSLICRLSCLCSRIGGRFAQQRHGSCYNLVAFHSREGLNPVKG